MLPSEMNTGIWGASTLHDFPLFWPLLHLSFLHCGQTEEVSVRYTSEVRWMFRLMSPVASSAVPEMLSAHLLTTQTGTLLARSGSGAPNVAPVGVAAPVTALKSHTVSLPELQPERQ